MIRAERGIPRGRQKNNNSAGGGRDCAAWAVSGIRKDSVLMALEAASMVTWEWNIRTGAIRYSKNMPDHVFGKSVNRYSTVEDLFSAIHPEDRNRLKRILGKGLRQGAPLECEYRVRLLDGRYHWILAKGRFVPTKGRKPVRMMGVSLDVTARKKIEKDLQERHRQLAELTTELILTEHRERRRLADLLHENLQQLLVGARMQIHALASGARGRRRDEWEAARRMLEEALETSRSLTRHLAPPLPIQKEIASALRWLVLDMQERHQLEVSLRMARVLPVLPEAYCVLLFTAARELLLNVVKHAGVLRAGLTIKVAAGRIQLSIRDAGQGLRPRGRPASDARPGFGLFSIRERADFLGGRLVTLSPPGGGLCVLLELPVPPPAFAPPASVPRKGRGGA